MNKTNKSKFLRNFSISILCCTLGIFSIINFLAGSGIISLNLYYTLLAFNILIMIIFDILSTHFSFVVKYGNHPYMTFEDNPFQSRTLLFIIICVVLLLCFFAMIIIDIITNKIFF